MTLKTKIIISIIVIALAYATGRYMSPEKIKTVEKTVEVEKVVVKVEHIVTTIKEKPDGTKETTTVTDSTTNSKSNKDSTTASKEITVSKDHLNISALVGIQLPLGSNSAVYGASVTKNILGPITLGAWGLSNASGGLSIGINF